MKLIVRQVEVPLEYGKTDIIEGLVKKLRCRNEDIKGHEVVRRSLDARPRRPAPVFILQVEVEVSDQLKKNLPHSQDIEMLKQIPVEEKVPQFIIPEHRPIVVGAGPAGLMAAFHLAMLGLKPIVIERGVKAEDRREVVDEFWRSGRFMQENNVLYGEGGAGLFSDGKLTARSKDRPRIRLFFETLVQCGAPPEIMIDSEPHLGSDILLEIVPRMRQIIEKRGGEFRFKMRLEHILFDGNLVNSVVASGEKFKTRHVILATGHSARDIYQLLAEAGVALEAKPFAVGVRLEVPQKQIDQSQYGEFAGHPQLKAASFKLTRKPENVARACYSFCMCPGGLVIACASEAGMLTTNGMSYSARSGQMGNAAFIVPVNPEDFSDPTSPYPVLAGLKMQQKIETAAFNAGGGNFTVPAARLSDFLNDRISQDLPGNRSCRLAKPADFNGILPEYIMQTLKSAIPPMLKELNQVNTDDALLYAAETRSSSPVRVLRDENGCSASHKGLFPAGEGAGYAGGIVSSAVDGLRAAEMLVESLEKP
ncbi:MAG: FAD-dependent protein [Candidatus Rifleibacteriota bacterium]